MGDRQPLNILDLNDFVLMKIFSNLSELEKYHCSLVCQHFSSIATSTYATLMEFDSKLNKYFDGPNDYRENLENCYGVIKSLGMYWKTIRISYKFSILRPDTTLKLVKKFCPNVEHLTLQFDKVESKFVLNNLPKKLKTISLSAECRCRENWLTPLQYCVNLEHLALNFTLKDNKKRLRDRKKMLRGEFLRHFPKLKILMFNGCRPGEHALKNCFHNSVNLSVLELNCDLVVKASSRFIEIILSKLTRLQRIKLQPTQTMRLDQLGLLKDLKFLSLDSWVPNDLNSLLRNLISSNRVQCFEVDNCQSFIHSDIISELHKWTNLRYLYVDYMESFDDRFLRQLATIGKLNYFHFSGRGRNVSVNEMIGFLVKSINLELFDFHIYYESSDTHTPDTVSDVQRLKEFQKAITERIKIITIYSTVTSVHCTGGFRVRKENAFQRSLASMLNLDLSKSLFGGALQA
ncbi:uncharacterized protein LOC119074620 isoform X2 [Bradysia coprophila]|nr:uncharacterized protein LOC119074620 isoform X2 [Bradysia coprophila]